VSLKRARSDSKGKSEEERQNRRQAINIERKQDKSEDLVEAFQRVTTITAEDLQINVENQERSPTSSASVFDNDDKTSLAVIYFSTILLPIVS
jgi:hypothetical protein